MAVTDVEAIKFVNEEARPAADRLAQAYYMAKRVFAHWTADNLGLLFPSGGGTVNDGAATDGRHPVTADDITILVGRLSAMITDYEANANTNLNSVLHVAVNTGG